MRILLNAESFGYGPSAAIARLFEKLKSINPEVELDFIGSGLSLDINSMLEYVHIFEYSDQLLTTILPSYDLFITAMDFVAAKIAKTSKTPVLFYDALSWYWKEKPDNSVADYYICQDFIGVSDVLKLINIPNKYMVKPSIHSNTSESNLKRERLDLAVINFGGLENPYFGKDTTTQYIKKMLFSLMPRLLEDFKDIVVLCSKSNADMLSKNDSFNFNIELNTLSYNKTQELLSKASLLIATPGLGNIYESSKHSLACLLLPPANDSQGQQLNLLLKHNILSKSLDWGNFHSKIDYFSEQANVMRNIANTINSFDEKSLSDYFSKINLDTLCSTKKLVSLLSAEHTIEFALADILAKITATKPKKHYHASNFI